MAAFVCPAFIPRAYRLAADGQTGQEVPGPAALVRKGAFYTREPQNALGCTGGEQLAEVQGSERSGDMLKVAEYISRSSNRNLHFCVPSTGLHSSEPLLNSALALSGCNFRPEPIAGQRGGRPLL